MSVNTKVFTTIIKFLRKRSDNDEKIFICLTSLLLCFVTMSACSENSITVKESIDKANFISVKFFDGASTVVEYVNLKDKMVYGDGMARKGNMYYANNMPYSSDRYGFNSSINGIMLYPIIADNTSKIQIIHSNYVIKKKITNFRDKELLSGDIWVNNKVKIFYNHKCLPVKVQTMNSRTKKWTTHIKLSYYKSTHKEYKKKWNAYVKRIKAGEFEDE